MGTVTMSKNDCIGNLQLESLLDDYDTGERSRRDVLSAIHAAAAASIDEHIWISLFSEDQLHDQLERATARLEEGIEQPLLGVPFAVKDNIDVAGVPTTAACPSFSRVPERSAATVQRLVDAGAIVVGKTNLDQFATGLVGSRSPYGACSSVFDPNFVSGGSSSGSALAVARGLVSFALGTDTAGSGRVPAAFNHIVGLKPSKGLLSTRGVVPACRSLDCVSVFAGNVSDAWRVLQLTAAFDPEDGYSRRPALETARGDGAFRFGVPADEYLYFDGDGDARALYWQAIERLIALGGQMERFDYAPFDEAARLLYQGPWVAERVAAVGEFVAQGSSGLDPTVKAIVEGGGGLSAVDAFRGQYRLAELKKVADVTLAEFDMIVLPTTPTIYTRAAVAEKPLELNSRLGRYTNFVNLLDLCGLAVPAGFRSDGLPQGVTLLAKAFDEATLCTVAARYLEPRQFNVGATAYEMLQSADADFSTSTPLAAPSVATVEVPARKVKLAVLGAHLQGQPLHYQLTELGARFVSEAKTRSCYRLYALAGTRPAKPGMARRASGGVAIAVEVYELDMAGFGRFVDQVPVPLCIGNIELSTGEWVNGFLCEPEALDSAMDISEFGGWRAYLAGLDRH